MIDGYLDKIVDDKVIGWAYHDTSPLPCEIKLYINGELNTAGFANQLRPGLKKKGKHPTGKCGFSIHLEKTSLDVDIEEVRAIAFLNEHAKELTNSPLLLYPNIHIFYQHIAKTGGTSLNELFAHHFPAKKVRFHIEGNRNWSDDQRAEFATYNFISGHVGLRRIAGMIDLSKFLKITVLRNPVRHLISHINWLSFVGQDLSSEFYLGHTEEVKQLAQYVNRFDFTTIEGVEKFKSDLPDEGYFLFDNCQTRYLISDPRVAKIDAAHFAEAEETLKQFDLVGKTEELDEFNAKVLDALGMPIDSALPRVKRLNANKAVKIIKNDSIAAEVLHEFVQFDKKIYESIS